jgi:hypothetical protein
MTTAAILTLAALLLFALGYARGVTAERERSRDALRGLEKKGYVTLSEATRKRAGL